MGNILYKYGWYRSLDNKFLNLYLTVSKLSGAHQFFFFVMKVLCPKGSVHSIKFRSCISNNVLPHQLVTMQVNVLNF